MKKRTLIRGRQQVVCDDEKESTPAPQSSSNLHLSGSMGGEDMMHNSRTDQLLQMTGKLEQQLESSSWMIRRSPRKAKPWQFLRVLLLGMLAGIPLVRSERAMETMQRRTQQQQRNGRTLSTTPRNNLALQGPEEGEEEIEIQRRRQQQQHPPEAANKDPIPAGKTVELEVFSPFPQCNYTTQELTKLSSDDAVEPCILFDIQPERLQKLLPQERTRVVTLVQVTPALTCNNHRDGATTSVELLNQENEGRGIAVGFHKDYYIQFRLISLIAGNQDNLGADAYGVQHSNVLQSAVTAWDADYIVGSCSFGSKHEKQPALNTQTMVFTQVGPPGFYKDNNPYVFGVHINSDEYPIPTVRALGFQAANVPNEDTSPTSLTNLPVRVLYRTKSEFFQSTCQSALRALREFGFADIKDIPFDPDADDDGDGVANALDEEYLIQLADESCPPGSGDYNKHYNPALFACLLKEQDIILERWKQNGCRPLSLWMTPATWGWAASNPSVVPYMFGGGQWHEAFSYSDRFFESGRDVLAHNEAKFGYYGNYDSVVSYAIPMIFAEHLESFYRVIDDPDPANDFKTPEGYEALRRAMIVLNTDTIFGPLSYNDDQRNIGRGAAGTQWQIQKTPGNDDDDESVYRNVLVSPFLQAEADSKLPAPSAVNCTPGYYVNETLVSEGDAILSNKCSKCPVDSFTAVSNQQLQCNACPKGSTTGGLTGESYCVQENDNLLGAGALSFGYVAVGITWIISLSFIGWLVINKSDPVVSLSQFEFMIMICVGAMISSSTIIALSLQASSDEDTDAATRGCQAAPFLYTIGWVLQYSSLSAKSLRLAKILNAQNNNRLRVTVTARETMIVVAFVLALDLIVVITWTATHPLEYIRQVISVEKDDTTNIVTISSSGSCKMEEGSPSIWAFTGPLIAIHATLMITTNIILFKVRKVADRYQEQKYVALASAFVFEVLVIGLPVLVSVGDNSVAVFIVLAGVIALNDIGMLCFVFIPKILFQRQKITDGVSVAETVLKKTYSKASLRESMRREPSQIGVGGQPYVSQLSTYSQTYSEMRGSGNSSHSFAQDGDDDLYGTAVDQTPIEESKPDIMRPASRGRLIESIMEVPGEDESEATFELNEKQEHRRSAQTPRTASTDDDEEDVGMNLSDGTEEHLQQQSESEEDDEMSLSDGAKGHLLQQIENATLKNYSLELEIDRMRDNEKQLKNRISELESLLKENSDEPS